MKISLSPFPLLELSCSSPYVMLCYKLALALWLTNESILFDACVYSWSTNLLHLKIDFSLSYVNLRSMALAPF